MMIDYFILIIFGIFLFCVMLSVLFIIDIHENPLLYIDIEKERNRKTETWKRNNPSIYRDMYDMPLWIGQRIITIKTVRNGDIEEWIGIIEKFEDGHCVVMADFDGCNYIGQRHNNNRFDMVRYFDENLDKEFLIKSTKKIGEDIKIKEWFETYG